MNNKSAGFTSPQKWQPKQSEWKAKQRRRRRKGERVRERKRTHTKKTQSKATCGSTISNTIVLMMMWHSAELWIGCCCRTMEYAATPACLLVHYTQPNIQLPSKAWNYYGGTHKASHRVRRKKNHRLWIVEHSLTFHLRVFLLVSFVIYLLCAYYYLAKRRCDAYKRLSLFSPVFLVLHSICKTKLLFVFFLLLYMPYAYYSQYLSCALSCNNKAHLCVVHSSGSLNLCAVCRSWW